MILVSSFGSIYRISEKEYAAALLGIRSGVGYRLNPKRYLGEIEANLTDLTPAEAQELAKALEASHYKRRVPYGSSRSAKSTSQPEGK